MGSPWLLLEIIVEDKMSKGGEVYPAISPVGANMRTPYMTELKLYCESLVICEGR